MKKENALGDFLLFLEDTWSWQLLTPDMRDCFVSSATAGCTCKAITGAYWQRWYALQAMYDIFLCGCGFCPGRFIVVGAGA